MIFPEDVTTITWLSKLASSIWETSRVSKTLFQTVEYIFIAASSFTCLLSKSLQTSLGACTQLTASKEINKKLFFSFKIDLKLYQNIRNIEKYKEII